MIPPIPIPLSLNKGPYLLFIMMIVHLSIYNPIHLVNIYNLKKMRVLFFFRCCWLMVNNDETKGATKRRNNKLSASRALNAQTSATLIAHSGIPSTRKCVHFCKVFFSSGMEYFVMTWASNKSLWILCTNYKRFPCLGQPHTQIFKRR